MAQRLFEWRDAILQADELTASDRHVAHVIGFRMNEHGDDAWPSIANIVRRTALSKSTVLDSLEWLRVSGWLQSKSRGRRTTKLYTATIPDNRLTRADRAKWAEERKRRLAARRTSRSESLLPSRSESGPTPTATPSRSESLQRVGRNRYAE